MGHRTEKALGLIWGRCGTVHRRIVLWGQHVRGSVGGQATHLFHFALHALEVLLSRVAKDLREFPNLVTFRLRQPFLVFLPSNRIVAATLQVLYSAPSFQTYHIRT